MVVTYEVTLVDTNVILELVTNDPDWSGWSIAQLEEAALKGPLCINDVVYAELSVRRPLFRWAAMRRGAFVWFHQIEFSSSQLVSTDPFRILKKFCTELSTRGCRPVLSSQFHPIEIIQPGQHGVGQARREKNIKIMGLFAPIPLL